MAIDATCSNNPSVVPAGVAVGEAGDLQAESRQRSHRGRRLSPPAGRPRWPTRASRAHGPVDPLPTDAPGRPWRSPPVAPSCRTRSTRARSEVTTTVSAGRARSLTRATMASSAAFGPPGAKDDRHPSGRRLIGLPRRLPTVEDDGDLHPGVMQAGQVLHQATAGRRPGPATSRRARLPMTFIPSTMKATAQPGPGPERTSNPQRRGAGRTGHESPGQGRVAHSGGVRHVSGTSMYPGHEPVRDPRA